jgi:hypothetical protein
MGIAKIASHSRRGTVMYKLYPSAVVAAVALAAGACAQTDSMPEESSTQSSSSTSTTSPSSSSSQNPDTDTTSSQASSDMSAGMGTGTNAVTVGLPVQSTTGSSLGSVMDVVTDPGSSTPAYIVVSTAGEARAVPYSAVSSMMRNGALVIEESTLRNAPTVQQGTWRDAANTQWRMESDRYWGSQGRMRSATPGEDTGTSGSDRSMPTEQPEQPSTELPRG